MGKILLKLSSSDIEKNIITAFKSEDNTYVVLDNETTGSMGLPIILVCKVLNDRVVKITDQMEWQKVKEALKNIIAGTDMTYVNVKSPLPADDVYYTQLTLPLASFDALKNSYKPTGDEQIPSSSVVTPEIPVVQESNAFGFNNQVIPESTPVMPEITPVVETPVSPVIAPVETPTFNFNTPVTPEPVIDPVVTVMPEIEPVVPTAPVIPEITPDIQPVVIPEEVVAKEEPYKFNEVSFPEVKITESTPEMPEVNNTPVVDTSVSESVNNNEIDFKEMKETFMKSCENMFDALVAKMQNK